MPSMPRCAHDSLEAQAVFSSAITVTASIRTAPVASPMMPIKNHKPVPSDCCAKAFHNARRGGNPARSGKPAVDNADKIKPVAANGYIRAIPWTEEKRSDSVSESITDRDSAQTA